MKNYVANASSDWGNVYHNEVIKASQWSTAFNRAGHLAQRRARKRPKQITITSGSSAQSKKEPPREEQLTSIITPASLVSQIPLQGQSRAASVTAIASRRCPPELTFPATLCFKRASGLFCARQDYRPGGLVRYRWSSRCLIFVPRQFCICLSSSRLRRKTPAQR